MKANDYVVPSCATPWPDVLACSLKCAHPQLQSCSGSLETPKRRWFRTHVKQEGGRTLGLV